MKGSCPHAASGCNYPEGECLGSCIVPPCELNARRGEHLKKADKSPSRENIAALDKPVK